MTHPAGPAATPFSPLGFWAPDGSTLSHEPAAFGAAVGDRRAPVVVVRTDRGPAVVSGGTVVLGGTGGSRPPLAGTDALPVAAYLPPLPPHQLGDPAFRGDHGLKYAYMTGAMANGIGSADIVEEMSRAGMLGSFGAAGLSVERVGQALDRIQPALGESPYCVNLIHSPNEPAHEMATAELLLRRGVRLVEASAYLDLTPAIVRYRLAGFGPDGRPHNRVVGKVSRVEVATKFLSPPPER